MQQTQPSTEVKNEPVQRHTQHHPHLSALFHHEPHKHQPRNVNVLHEAEQTIAGWNTRVAVALTKGVGTMWTAYAFALLAFIGLFALLGLLPPTLALLIAWASQTFLQLVFLPILLVGQNVLGRKAELQSEEQFHTTMRTYHDIEQVIKHLSAQDDELLHLTKHLLAQDAELLRHAQLLTYLLEKHGISLEQLGAEGATTTPLHTFVQAHSSNGVSAPAAPAQSKKETERDS